MGRVDLEVATWILSASRPDFMGESQAKTLAMPRWAERLEAWHAGFQYAERLGVKVPLALALERSSFLAQLPESIRLRVQERVRREQLTLARQDAELEGALFLLLGARLPVLVFQGMDFGRRFYPERILRSMDGIDLLIPADTFNEALRVLGRGGYRAVAEDGFGASGKSVSLARKGSGPCVVLHQGLLSGEPRYGVDEAWDRAIENSLPGLPHAVRAFHPEDLLVYWIRRGAVELMLERAVWVNDLHFLIESQRFQKCVDWEAVQWKLSRYHALSGAWLVLDLLQTEWRTSGIPRESLKSFSKKISPVRRRMLSRLSRSGAWFHPSDMSFSQKFRTSLLLGDTAWDALKLGFRPLGKSGASPLPSELG